MKKFNHGYIYGLLLIPYLFILINYITIPKPYNSINNNVISINSIDYLIPSLDFHKHSDYYFENEDLNWSSAALPFKFTNNDNNLVLIRILLPDSLTSNDSFLIRLKDQIFEIYIEKQMLYNLGEPDKNINTSTHGTYFASIRLSPEFSNKYMYIYSQSSSYNNFSEIMGAHVGDRANIAINNYFIFNYKLLTSSFLFVNSIILFIIYFTTKSKENDNLISAGLFTFTLSLYFFSKAPIISLYIQNISILVIIEYISICLSKIYLLCFIHQTIKNKNLKPFFNFIEIIVIAFISLIFALSLFEQVYLSDFYRLIEMIDVIIISYVVAIISISAVFLKETEPMYIFKCGIVLAIVLGILILFNNVLGYTLLKTDLTTFDAVVVLFCLYLNFSVIKKSIIKYNKLNMFNLHLTANNEALYNLTKSKVVFDEIRNENILFKTIFNELYNIFNEQTQGFVIRNDKNNHINLLYDTNNNKKIDYYKQLIDKLFEYENIKKIKILYNKNSSLINLSINDDETTLLYVKKETPFDTYIFNIFYDNILNSFNNIKIYNTIQKEQKELVTFIGNVLDKREANKSNCLAVYEICKIFAKNLGFNETEIEDIALASCINNVGKFAVHEEVLIKDESELNDNEYEELIHHHAVGYSMLSKLSGEIMFIASQIAKDYYEHFDGSGLNGLKGEAISIYTRIVKVAYELVIYVNKNKNLDNYDFDKCLIYFISNAGIFFDPKVIKIALDNRVKFEDIIDTYPIKTL